VKRKRRKRKGNKRTNSRGDNIKLKQEKYKKG
jgi:hypothetical protein